MKPINLFDFSRGYNVDIPNDLLQGGDLAVAENCVWAEGGLIQRSGNRPYNTNTFSASDVVRGVSNRVYSNHLTAWACVVAIDLDATGTVRFYSLATTGALSLLSATYEFTTGLEVHFAELAGYIVAVNGTDAPVALRYTGASWNPLPFELVDQRVWDVTTWKAGQYTSIGGVYTDDTTDAQDAGAGDFPITTTTNNDGFWVSCAHPFQYVSFATSTQMTGSPVVSYQYYTGTGWAALTLTTTPVWTAVAGTRVMEWDYLSGMGRYDGAESVLANRFCIRALFTTAPTGAGTCAKLTVIHRQYLTEAMAGGIANRIGVHLNRLFLSDGNTAFYTPPNKITDIRGASESEVFPKGGEEIRAFVSQKGYMIVFKDNFTYAFYGATVLQAFRKEVSPYGIVSDRAYAATEQGVFYISVDGIRLNNGSDDVRVSRHINTEVVAYDTTGAVGVYYDGYVIFSFPAESIALRFDPASLSIDKATGEGRISVFKYTVWDVNYFIPMKGQGDANLLAAVVNDTTPYIARLENGETDQLRAGTEVAIAQKMRIPYLPIGMPTREKEYGLMHLKLKRDADEATTYTVTLYRDNGADSASVTVTVAAGTTDYVHESRIPYTMDGYSLSVEISNSEVTTAGVGGIELEYQYKET